MSDSALARIGTSAPSEKPDPAAVKKAADPKRDIIDRIAGSVGGAFTSLERGASSFQASTGRLANSTVTSKELAALNKYIAQFGQSINGKIQQDAMGNMVQVGGLAGEGGIIDSASDYLASGLSSILRSSDRVFGNLSQHTGGVLAAANYVLKDPLDLNRLGNLSSKLLESVMPGGSKKMNATIQKLNLDKLSRVPQLLLSGINNLITAVDNLLAIPIAFVASLYYGALGIIKRIAKEINQILDVIMQFIFSFLDDLIPITEILEFLDTVSTLSSQIGGIAGGFLGVNQITGITTQITSFANDISGILQNPLDTIISYLPNEVTQIYYALNNPETVINRLLPPQLSSALSVVTKMSGYGYNGNMGYSFGAILQGIQGGVIRGLLNNFSAQFGVLGPLLGGTGSPVATYAPQLLNGKWDTGLNDKTTEPFIPYTRETTAGGEFNPNARVRRAIPVQ